MLGQVSLKGYLPIEVVGGAYFHGMYFFAMEYFSKYIHYSIWSFNDLVRVLSCWQQITLKEN